MKVFQGKKILFISTNFFGYEKEIQKTLVNLGAQVDFWDDRPKNTFFYKALIRVNKNILRKRIEFYYDTIIDGTKDKEYDYIFFLKAESISNKSLMKLKNIQNKAVFILYLWDSIGNRNDVKPLLKQFDKVLSFDKNDIKKYPFMCFRPLFYIEDYAKIKQEKLTLDVCFIGTGHSDRYKIIQTIKKYCSKEEITGFYFMYLQGRIIFYYRKFFSNTYRKSKIKDFSYVSLTQKEVIKIIESSKAVLDIQHHKQTGLTMRTLEVLGAKKKLITTNKDIINYDFYHPNNILVINRENPEISKHFFNTPYLEVGKNIYEKYSLKNWLIDVILTSLIFIL